MGLSRELLEASGGDVPESIGEGIGGDVEKVKGEAVFKAFQAQMSVGRKQGELKRKKLGGDADDVDDVVGWLEENAQEEIDAAIRSLKVLEHYAGTGILGFDNRTNRATADLSAELNAVFYRIGQISGLRSKA